MIEIFEDRELLLRAVWPPNRKPNFWVKGRLSSAALKDPKGLSVDRTADRALDAAILSMRSRLSGYIVSIPVPACSAVNAYLRHKPSQGNPHHSEIHGSKSEVILSDEQAFKLSRAAALVYNPTEDGRA